MPPPDRPFSARVTDEQVQTLLTRHRCPTPMHVLRMRFLGAIASPRMEVSPIQWVTQAWGGELPEFASEVEAEELFQALLGGWWNRLSEHQNARSPFRLPRSEVKPTRPAMLALALARQQELEGFVDGLFGDDEQMDMPEKAHRALTVLAEIHAMFAGIAALLSDESKAAPAQELADLLRNVQKLTITTDEAINRIIQSCKLVRSQRIEHLTFVESRRFTARQAAEGDDDDEDARSEKGGSEDGDRVLIQSPLSQTVTRNGVTAEVHIYKGADSDWILEMVDAAGTSHVWDNEFETDQQAFDEAMRALDEEPLAFMEPTPGSKAN